MAVSNIFGNLRLGAKLNAVVLLGMVVLLVTIMVVIFASADSFITRVGRQRAEQESLVVQSRFKEAEQEVLASGKFLASRPLIEAIAGGVDAEIRTLVLVSMALLDLDDVDLVDADGTHLMTLQEEGGTLYSAQEQEMLSLALLGIERTGVVIEEDELNLKLAAAIPLRDTSGNIVGALLASREVNDDFLAESNFSREDVHLVLIVGGRILARDLLAPELEEFHSSLLEEATIEQVMDGQSLVADDTLRSAAGVPYALIHVPLTVRDETYAVIGILVDLGDLVAFQRQLTLITAAIFVFIALAAIAVMGVFTRRSIVVPLGKLITVVEGMASGDYGQRAEVTTRDEIGQLGDNFNQMAAQLQGTLESLEQREVDLRRRSLQMQASADVGRAATSILEIDRLIQHVVDLIRERFGLYYVGLFLVDETGEWAVLRAGTGEAGQIMLSRGHQIKVGHGMIGWCIEHAEARVVEEAGEDAVRLVTSELPDTRSEAALALRSRDKVLGALTVQSDLPGAFDEQTVAVLQTLADQVAVAIDNAGLFAESQAALEAERRAYGELSRRAWFELMHARSIVGYHYGSEQGRAIRLSGDGQRPEPAEELPEVELPVRVHGAVIGTINAHKPADAGAWTSDEVSMLEELADQLGIAMESARLYQDTQRRAARERLVGDIAGHLQRAPDMEMLLQIAAQELNRALSGSRAYVRLGVGGREDDG